jgi:hypothetical protein
VGTLSRARIGRALGRAWFVALLVAVCFLYRFIGSAGLRDWPVYGVYHDLQADAFLGGHLFLPIDPAPQLLHAKDPYDVVNAQYWWVDATFYRGKYYMYWGPVPALFQAAGKWLLGVKGRIGDQYLAVAFYCLAFWCAALLVDRMLRRLFQSRSRWLLALGALVVACANPSPHGVATASTYHTAIIAAQAWLCAGLLVAFDAVWYAGSVEARWWRLPLAGTFLALAVGSRVSVALAAGFIALFAALGEAWPAPRRARRLALGVVSIGLPLLAAGVALLVYNELRFDRYLEFGSKLQLTWFPIRFSARYLAANLYSYALRPGVWSCEFPYLEQVWRMGDAAFPRWFPVPKDYLVLEPIVGWVRAVPITWFMPFAFAFATTPKSSRHGRTYLFCLLSFTVLATLSGVLPLFVYTGTMRYLNDVSLGLVLLGLLGAFALRFHRWGEAAPRAISASIAALGCATIGMGLCLGYQGYNSHFRRSNPGLDAKLVHALSFCGAGGPSR